MPKRRAQNEPNLAILDDVSSEGAVACLQAFLRLSDRKPNLRYISDMFESHSRDVIGRSLFRIANIPKNMIKCSITTHSIQGRDDTLLSSFTPRTNRRRYNRWRHEEKLCVVFVIRS
jgi:hypothetical protein